MSETSPPADNTKSRRQFLGLMGRAIASMTIAGPLSSLVETKGVTAAPSAKLPPEEIAPLPMAERLMALPARETVQLNGFYMIPDDSEHGISHSNTERVIIPLHRANLLPRFQKQDISSKQVSPYDIYVDGYLDGAIKAAKRGQDVTMVLEMPTDASVNKTTDRQEWQSYLEWLIPRLSAKRIVIGNEMELTELTKNGKEWNEWADLFAIAHDVIREHHKNMEIVLSGTAYFGEGEQLKNQIDAIEVLNQHRVQQKIKPVSVDSVAVHFYDEASKLPDYIEQQRNVLASYPNWKDKPIHLTEIGVPELERKATTYTKETQARYHLTSMAVASALLDANKIASVYPYTAYSNTEPVHSVFENRQNRLFPKPAYKAYELARRMFYKDVTYKTEGAVAVVSGHTANNEEVTMVWNTGDQDVEVPLTLSGELYEFTNDLTPLTQTPNVLKKSQTMTVEENSWKRCSQILISIKKPYDALQSGLR